MSGCAVFVLGACAGLAGAAQPSEIATWSEPVGIAPELVFVTDVDGYELATQSVGIMAGDGMSAWYVRDAATVMLTTWRDPDPDSSLVACADLSGDLPPAGDGAPLDPPAAGG